MINEVFVSLFIQMFCLKSYRFGWLAVWHSGTRNSSACFCGQPFTLVYYVWDWQMVGQHWDQYFWVSCCSSTINPL